MQITTLTLVGLLFAGDPQAAATPDAAQIRQVIERSLPFLEKGATDWVAVKKCTTCHHVPMMLWTHFEAKKRGFAVNDKAMADLESAALSEYLGHPEMMPTGQDKGFMEKPIGPGTIYLSLALQANSVPNDAAGKALERFRQSFVQHQNENGSWTTKINSPPIIDDHDSMTFLILAALDGVIPRDKYRELRERTRQWLKETPIREETQPLSLRVLAAVSLGDKEEVPRGVARLVARQDADGGWSQKEGLGTDALATGEALYALSAAGASSDDPVVQQAWRFLVTTQNADGSWLVHTRNPNGHDPIPSFVGTGWATLALLRTLPQ